MKYIKELDTLRFFAVLLVIHQHWGPYNFNTPGLTFFSQKILPTGGFAVDFFFVLSGFLITNILIQSKQTRGSVSKFVVIKNFIIRRALRIFPIYYLCVLLLFILDYPDIRHYFIYFMTYTSNFEIFYNNSWNLFSHTWSLAVEEQFYLLWPWLILFIPYKYLWKIMIVFIISSPIITAVTANIYGEMVNILPWNCFGSFALGGIYAYSLHDTIIGSKIQKALLWSGPIAIVLYVLHQFDVKNIPVRLINAIIAVNIIIYIIEKRYGKIANAILNNKTFNNLGKISYGMYLYHYLIPHFYFRSISFLDKKIHFQSPIKSILTQPDIAEILQLLILILISYLSYQFIEINILKFKKYFDYPNVQKNNFKLYL